MPLNDFFIRELYLRVPDIDINTRENTKDEKHMYTRTENNLPKMTLILSTFFSQRPRQLGKRQKTKEGKNNYRRKQKQ